MEAQNYDRLHGAMSFDNIWNEISLSECSRSGESPVFVVSWNDHFFVLKVEAYAYYIIDTLEERLYERCNQVYTLKFDRDMTIYRLPHTRQSSKGKPVVDKHTVRVVESDNSNIEQHVESKDGLKEGTLVNGTDDPITSEEEEVICRGKERYKEYIKSFLAAIPMRELQDDIKKGLITPTPLHQRLQIEFHFSQLEQQTTVTRVTEDHNKQLMLQ
ncbi:unnamed protein product [Fraxinus pennsylvanica]|uniref:Uncharacterized protein n=1 Tax=Fraxinus pennsylvanica TaxID=56036 RepID=A0AAD2A1J8_9LAMI|nr:unnamed protein product [Fraxinus pennsylvanica]